MKWFLLLTMAASYSDGQAGESAGDLYVSRYNIERDKPPSSVPTNWNTDGSILGNGDLGVVIGGPPENQQYWISKCDFWHAKPLYPWFTPALVGHVDLRIPALRGASYHTVQRLDSAEVQQTFATKDTTVTIRSWTPATQNALVLEISCIGKPVEIEVVPETSTGNGATVKSGQQGDVRWITRSFVGPEMDWPNQVTLAVRSPDERHLSLSPFRPVLVLATTCTNHETKDFQQKAISDCEALDPAKIEELRRKHRLWWRQFWQESMVEIGDPLLEKFYYGSFYTMACCSRNPAFPPAIFGNQASGDLPAMGGDYHLNYNYQAPWWGCYIANHLALTEPYDTPVLQFLERGKMMAHNYLGKKGVLFSVGIGPLGSSSDWTKPHHQWEDDSEDKHFFAGQKSNAAFCTTNMIMRWRSTYDLNYGRKVYPFLLEVANFWEDYLVLEKGRYIDYNDSIQEGSGPDVNNLLSLGLIRGVFETVVDLSTELGIDESRRAKWNDILLRLSDYSFQKVRDIKTSDVSPEFLRDPANLDKTVFRYSEKGFPWSPDCALGIQHIYPAGAFGLESEPNKLEAARNTVSALGRWDDANHTMTLYPAAARVGYDPEILLSHLREQCESHGFPNLVLNYGGGGIETCSTVTATINEMLLQSHQNVMHLFADWPKGRDARFEKLRAYGAFLVSASQKRGVIGDVQILSEQGRNCSLANPWPGRVALLTHGDHSAETLEGVRFAFKTHPNEHLSLEPEQAR